MKLRMNRPVPLLTAAAVCTLTLLSSACSTTPKASDQASFIADSNSALTWFKSNVPGLDNQLANSGGYIVFPNMGQWGILFGGGQHGNGYVVDPDGNQVGWAAINTGSVGLQAGVRGFKMLMVFEDQWTFDKFIAGNLTGSASGVAVAGDSGDSGLSSFEDGVAVYQGASTGLIAGVNIGLNYVDYEPLD